MTDPPPSSGRRPRPGPVAVVLAPVAGELFREERAVPAHLPGALLR